MPDPILDQSVKVSSYGPGHTCFMNLPPHPRPVPHAVLTGSVDREPPFGPSGLAMLPHQLAGHYRQHDLSQPHSLAVPFPLSETPFPDIPGW